MSESCVGRGCPVYPTLVPGNRLVTRLVRFLTATPLTSGLTDTDVHPTVPVMFDHTAAKAHRLERGITPTNLASTVGVSERTITRWEAGRGEPSYRQGLLMEAALGLPPGGLWADDESRDPVPTAGEAA